MDLSKTKELSEKIFKKSGTSILLILAALGLLMVSISDSVSAKKDNKTSKPAESLDTYKNNIERELSDIISCIAGAGDVKVLVTLESGEETVYAWQEKSTDDTQTVSTNTNNQQSQKNIYENQIVIVSDGNEKKALIEKTMQPAVQGVVVVCQGADNIKVVSDITNAVSVAMNITSNRVCVIKMQ